mmetsp:Transcript_17608/g.45557  ORF Transcript_17608/g.45557 Transcript_17608/m.45557 type:complete len:482 (-) Transcript_17608:101-1546(-)
MQRSRGFARRRIGGVCRRIPNSWCTRRTARVPACGARGHATGKCPHWLALTDSAHAERRDRRRRSGSCSIVRHRRCAPLQRRQRPPRPLCRQRSAAPRRPALPRQLLRGARAARRLRQRHARRPRTDVATAGDGVGRDIGRPRHRRVQPEPRGARHDGSRDGGCRGREEGETARGCGLVYCLPGGRPQHHHLVLRRRGAHELPRGVAQHLRLLRALPSAASPSACPARAAARRAGARHRVLAGRPRRAHRGCSALRSYGRGLGAGLRQVARCCRHRRRRGGGRRRQHSGHGGRQRTPTRRCTRRAAPADTDRVRGAGGGRVPQPSRRSLPQQLLRPVLHDVRAVRVLAARNVRRPDASGPRAAAGAADRRQRHGDVLGRHHTHHCTAAAAAAILGGGRERRDRWRWRRHDAEIAAAAEKLGAELLRDAVRGVRQPSCQQLREQLLRPMLPAVWRAAMCAARLSQHPPLEAKVVMDNFIGHL